MKDRQYLTKGTDTDPTVFRPPNDCFRIYNNLSPAITRITFINGLEFEGQTNFKWAPQPFTGIVFSGNLTFMKSKSSYQSTLFKSIPNPNFGKINPITGTIDSRRNILTNYDTAYVDRLVKQPSFLANVSLGYDIGGFSARISFSYQADILNAPQTRPDGADKEVTMAFSRWDLQVKQRIHKRISLFVNMTNIFNCPDRSIREVTGYYSAVEYYGMGANLGVKVDIF